jgi:hypothetical protein
MRHDTGIVGAALWLAVAVFLYLTEVSQALLVASLGGVIIHALYRHRANILISLFLYSQLLFPIEFLVTRSLGLDFYFLLEPTELSAFFLIQLLALVPFLVITPAQPLSIEAFDVRDAHQARFIIFVTAGAVLLCALFGIKGTVILGTGSGDFDTYVDNLEQNSGVIEYALIPLLLLTLVVRNVGRYYILLFAAAGLFIGKCLLMGFRIQGMTAVLILFVIFLRNIRPIYLPFMFVAGVASALLLGVLKFATQFEVTDLFMHGDFLQTTQSGVLVSSTMALRYMEFSPGRLLLMPFTFLLPPSVLRDQSLELYPGLHLQVVMGSPGGIAYSAYGYVFASWLGVLLAGAVVSWFAAQLSRRRHTAKAPAMFAALTFFIFFPRWSLYDFGNYGLRMAVWSFFFLVALQMGYQFLTMMRWRSIS